MTAKNVTAKNSPVSRNKDISHLSSSLINFNKRNNLPQKSLRASYKKE